MTQHRIALALAAALLAAATASGQTTGQSGASSTGAVAASDSPLVKAAKDAAARRESGAKSRLSINDKDVKKSSGKLIETTSKPLPPVRAAEDVETRMRAEKAAAEAKKDGGREQAARDLAAAEKKVADLESELRRIEESYYDEDDPDFREDVIEKRFEETKTKLEKARQELESAKGRSESAGTARP